MRFANHTSNLKMTRTTEEGHVLVIPVPTDAIKQGRRSTIRWNDKMQDHSGDYYAFLVKNKNTGRRLPEVLLRETHANGIFDKGSTVVFFIQPEHYNDATLIEVGTKIGQGKHRKDRQPKRQWLTSPH